MGLLRFYREKPRAAQSGEMGSHSADRERPSTCRGQLFLISSGPLLEGLGRWEGLCGVVSEGVWGGELHGHT